MNHPVRCAIDRARGDAKVEQLPGPPGREQPDLLAGRFAGDPEHLLLKAKLDQDSRAVGRELDAGAKLAQLARLLENLDLDASLQQRQAGDEAADARARDQDFRLWLCTHAAIASKSGNRR